jgi:hypothetical protein
MGTQTSFEVAKNLFLVRQTIAKGAPPKVVEQNTNHIAVIDCSGSMSADLPQIRAQLKKKLPKLLKEGDTLSIIWFSGLGQFGALIENEPVATLGDLAVINTAIDRWLKPVGMTGFKEPLCEVEDLVKRISKKNKNPFALFFMSDGCDNTWRRPDILATVERVAGGLASSTFVEYGYYADRQLLASMAAKAGGTLIFAEDFDRYEPVFEAAMAKRPLGGKRIEIKVPGDPIGGIAWSMADDEITAYEVTGNKATVPENTEQIFYLSPTKIGDSTGLPQYARRQANGERMIGPDVYGLDAAYAALSLFAVRMQPAVVFPLLKALGDVAFIEQFTNCFGKQAYSAFMDAAKEAAFSDVKRFTKGWDPNNTVLDLLSELVTGDAQLLLDHPSFKYSRVSRARVNADENLSSAESEKLEELQAKLKGEKKAAAIKAVQAEIDALLAAKRDALVFVADEAPNGYPINGLVYNEDRPNISLRVRKAGHVDLSKRADADPKVKSAEGADQFKTFIYRNYTIVKDGLVNIEKLPVKISDEVHRKLHANGVEMVTNDGVTIINVKPLPIINRKMVTTVSAKHLIELQYELTKMKAAQKVFNAYQKELFPEAKLAGWISQFGEQATQWLKDQGLTEYSGFSPKMVQAESTDVYMGKELTVALKGYSTLPPVEKVKEKLKAKGKLNGPESMMAEAIDVAEATIKGFEKESKATRELMFTNLVKTTTATVRGLMHQATQIKFAVIVGQVWFSEFKSLDENTMTVKCDGKDIVGTLDLREIEIKV